MGRRGGTRTALSLGVASTTTIVDYIIVARLETGLVRDHRTTTTAEKASRIS
jgi:hypothetical protein